jgi:hypothetical protein
MAAAVKPLADYVSGQQGRSGGEADTRSGYRLSAGQVLQALSVLAAVAAVFAVLYHH